MTELLVNKKRTKIDSKETGYDIPIGYFQELKRNTIVEIRNETPFSNKTRGFISSVLSRAFGWKDGRVPCESIKQAQTLMPEGKLQ